MPRHSTKILCVCKNCGRTFHQPPSRIKEGKGKFCSSPCYRIGGQIPLFDRFKKHLAKPNENGCILWTGKKHSDGYGLIRAGGSNLDELFTHRVSYLMAFGPFDTNLFVCHRCDVPACCNPDHLFLGTNKDNMNDCKEKGRHVHGERCPAAKLTDKKVKQMRQLYADKIANKTDLSKSFGVSMASISDALARRTWKHV